MVVLGVFIMLPLILDSAFSERVYKLNIIIVILGEDVNYGYFATRPMYDLALERATGKYAGLLSNSTINVLYQPLVADCAEAGSMMNAVAGKMFDLADKKSGSTLLFSPGCSLEVAPLADFAREMNILLIASTSADSSFANRKRYPTFVSFGPTGEGGHVPSLKRFLKLFSWTTITVFCESSWNYLNVASFFGLICRNIKTMIVGSDEFTVYYEDFDSRENRISYRRMLERARSQCRDEKFSVIVLESREDVVQRIMIAAYHLNMTSNEFIFLYPEPNRLPLYISLLDRTAEFTDEVAERAFDPLIVLNFDYPDWSRTAPVFQAVAESARIKYNYTYRPDEMVNDDSLSAYEATTSVAMVLSESWTDARALTAQNLRSRLINRTYALDTRLVTIGSRGFRLTNIVYSRFNCSAGTFEPTWTYSSGTEVFETISDLAYTWNGLRHPPSNEPACGYRGTLCAGQRLRDHIIEGIACVIGCIGIAAILLFAHNWQQKFAHPSWWILDSSGLSKKNRLLTNTTSTQTIKHGSVDSVLVLFA